MLRLCIALWCLISTSGPAFSQVPRELLQEIGLAAADSGSIELSRLQEDLAWVGLYYGPLSGLPSGATRRAIAEFQQSLGDAPTGSLTAAQRQNLAQRAQDTQRGYRFSRRTVTWLGLTMDFPMAVMHTESIEDETSPNALVFEPNHFSAMYMRAWERRVSVEPRDMASTYVSAISNREDFEKIIAQRVSANGFILQYDLADTQVIFVGERRGQIWRLAQLSAYKRYTDTLRPVVARFLRGLNFFGVQALSRQERVTNINSGNAPGRDRLPEWYRTMTSNGSGSLVTARGHVLTNQHVIDGCNRLTVNGSEARVIGADARLDLALIYVEDLVGRRPIKFRDANPALGEDVAVMGYPLFGLSQSLNFTTGRVSSTVGAYGDRTRAQVTAPIQPGNSGGPVLDADGRQIAVVVSIPGEFFQDMGAENIGWVIRGQDTLQFMSRFGIEPILESSAPSPVPQLVDDLAALRSMVSRVECHEN